MVMIQVHVILFLIAYSAIISMMYVDQDKEIKELNKEASECMEHAVTYLRPNDSNPCPRNMFYNPINERCY